jgi:allophanate hydrolase subunit 1
MTPRISTHKEELEEVILEANRVKEAKEASDKRVALLQYINTGILTLILAIASMTASLLINVNKAQSAQDASIVKLQTVQENNVNKVKEIDARVTRLEINYIEDLKTWIEANYIRKPQVK